MQKTFEHSFNHFELIKNLDYKQIFVNPLGSDAESFSQAGIPSVTFSTELSSDIPSIYHTRYDTIEKLSSIKLKTGVMILNHLISNFKELIGNQ